MIETLGDWNTRLGYCGCCPMPVCPTPVMICQSIHAGISLQNAFKDGIVPAGEFDLALWKAYRKFRHQVVASLDVDDDQIPSGGFHTIGTGSVTFTASYSREGFLLKFGCTLENPQQTIDYSGDGSFNVTRRLNYSCGGVAHKRTRFEAITTFTHIGRTPNPDPPPDDFAANVWRVDFSDEEFFYICTGGVLVDDGSDLVTQSELSTHPSVYSTDAVAVHPDVDLDEDFSVEEPFTWEEWLAEATAAMPDWIEVNKAAGCWATSSENGCRARTFHNPPSSYPPGPNTAFIHYFYTLSVGIEARPLRFRFRIPNTHPGSIFRISYDVAEFPESWDATIDDPDYEPPDPPDDPPLPIPQIPDPDAPPTSFVSEDNVIEWTGPGTGGSSDPSWLTEWIEIDPPEVPGERRVVNIRFTCYTGEKFGSKPQVTGEAFTPPEPDP